MEPPPKEVELRESVTAPTDVPAISPLARSRVIPREPAPISSPSALGFGPVDEDIFAWPADKRAQIKALPTSLEEAMNALERDQAFLLDGDVFSADLIERWIARKRSEEREVRNRAPVWPRAVQDDAQRLLPLRCLLR